jgi:hypothetical protein
MVMHVPQNPKKSNKGKKSYCRLCEVLLWGHVCMPEMKRSIPWTRKKKRKGKIKKVGIGNSFCSKRTRMQHTSNFLKSSKG